MFLCSWDRLILFLLMLCALYRMVCKTLKKNCKKEFECTKCKATFNLHFSINKTRKYILQPNEYKNFHSFFNLSQNLIAILCWFTCFLHIVSLLIYVFSTYREGLVVFVLICKSGRIRSNSGLYWRKMKLSRIHLAVTGQNVMNL